MDGRLVEEKLTSPRDTPQNFGFWNFSVWGRNNVRIIVEIPSSEILFLFPKTISFTDDLGMTQG
jgi:hypothetical protein